MPKIKLNLDELHDGDVTWISLVERGANRAPIKITKANESEDDGMIDLAKKLFQKREDPAKKGDELPWGVAAVVIRKDVDSQKLIEEIRKIHGISAAEIDETEDAFILKQDGYKDNDDSLVALKLNEDVAVFLSNARKFFDPFSDSTDFNENMATAGFFPGLQMSFEAMMKTAMGIMRNSDKKREARAKLETALGDFNKFVMGLAQNLPETAFKLEELDQMAVVGKVETEDYANEGADGDETKKDEDAADRAAGQGDLHDTCPPGQVRDPESGECVAADMGAEENASAVDNPAPSDLELKAQEAEKVAKEAREAADAEKAQKEGADDKKDCGCAKTADDGDEGSEGAKKAEGLEGFLAKIQEVIQKATEPLNREIQGVRKDVKDTQEKLSGVEQTAQAAHKAVSGKVPGADRAAQEDLGMPNHDNARKDDEKKEVWKGCLDELWNVPLEEIRG